MSVKQRVKELNERLAEKLTEKGVEANGNETTTELINKVDNISVGVDAEVYDGEYEVTPSQLEQKLETFNKLLKDDVTVKSIPYYEVDNIENGVTVIIGG